MFLLSLCYFDRLLRRSAAHCQCNLEICAWDFIFLECHAEFRMTFRGNCLPLHKIQLRFHIDRHQSIRDGHIACEYIVINAMFYITGALRCSKMFYVSENILAVDAGFKVSRAFLVEICGSSSFPFPLSTSRKQLDLSSNFSDLSKATIPFLIVGHCSILCEHLPLKKLLFVIFEVSLYVEAIYHF